FQVHPSSSTRRMMSVSASTITTCPSWSGMRPKPFPAETGRIDPVGEGGAVLGLTLKVTHADAHRSPAMRTSHAHLTPETIRAPLALSRRNVAAKALQDRKSTRLNSS